jgi:hypothetical protein
MSDVKIQNLLIPNKDHPDGFEHKQIFIKQKEEVKESEDDGERKSESR